MKVIIEIPDKVYENAKNGMLDELQSMLICGSVTEGKPLPKDATNGDMVLATGMFSVVKKLNDGIMVYVKPKGVFGQVLEYTKDWWDAPFKGSEGKA